MMKLDFAKNNTLVLPNIKNVLSDEAYRVAAYARVSTDKDDQANSFESQKKYFEDYIAQQENCVLVDIYSDEGITGTMTNNRVSFNKMISDAMAGKIDYIITHCLPQDACYMLELFSYSQDAMTLYFNNIAQIAQFDRWFCGHYHCNERVMGKFDVLYEKIMRII